MRTRQLCSLLCVTLAGAWLLAAEGSEARLRAAPATHEHQDAATMQNPVKPDAASIAAGKKLYDQMCVECHGEGGKGDGARAPYSAPTPPNLTDAEWKHGSTDGELFTVIRDGVDGTDMAPFGAKGEKLSDTALWNIVNYVRSLGTPAKSH